MAFIKFTAPHTYEVIEEFIPDEFTLSWLPAIMEYLDSHIQWGHMPNNDVGCNHIRRECIRYCESQGLVLKELELQPVTDTLYITKFKVI